jgi:Flp pilus assembly protein CpaB
MRSRLPIILLLVIVVVVGVVAFVLVGNPPTNEGQPPTADPLNNPNDPPPTENVVLPTPTPILYVNVVRAIQEIPRGVIIAPNMVDLAPWPVEIAPEQAFGDVEEVLGLVARTDIYREQPVLSSMVVPQLSDLTINDNRYSIGSDAAAVIPSNRVAVAVPMDRLTSVAYAIKSGDRVDVIVSFLFVDIDRTYQSQEPNAFQPLAPVGEAVDGFVGFEAVGIPFIGEFTSRPVPGSDTVIMGIIMPWEFPRPRLATQRTIMDALVVWTGDFPLDGRMFAPAPTSTPIPPTPVPGEEQPTPEGPPTPTPLPPRPDIVTLAVAPQDAVVLTWLVEARIPITFALRSASAPGSAVQTDTVSLDYIMQRFSIAVPEKFEFSLEPAIRSIRQLSVGDTISLDRTSNTNFTPETSNEFERADSITGG